VTQTGLLATRCVTELRVASASEPREAVEDNVEALVCSFVWIGTRAPLQVEECSRYQVVSWGMAGFAAAPLGSIQVPPRGCSGGYDFIARRKRVIDCNGGAKFDQKAAYSRFRFCRSIRSFGPCQRISPVRCYRAPTSLRGREPISLPATRNRATASRSDDHSTALHASRQPR
jgi:hypothetical protein